MPVVLQSHSVEHRGIVDIHATNLQLIMYRHGTVI